MKVNTGAEKMVCNQRRTEAGASHFFGLCSWKNVKTKLLRCVETRQLILTHGDVIMSDSDHEPSGI